MAPTAKRIPPEGDTKRYVYVEAPKCSHCGSTRLRVYGKLPRDVEGMVRRYTRCGTCGGKFIIIEKCGPSPSFDVSDRGLPIIMLPPVLCPFCSGDRYRSRRSVSIGGGMSKRHMQCLGCNKRFFIVAPQNEKQSHRRTSTAVELKNNLRAEVQQ